MIVVLITKVIFFESYYFLKIMRLTNTWQRARDLIQWWYSFN